LLLDPWSTMELFARCPSRRTCSAHDRLLLAERRNHATVLREQ
jgi:hypothetical protein